MRFGNIEMMKKGKKKKHKGNLFTSSAFVYRSNYIFPLPQQDNATEHRAFTLLSLILIFSSKFQKKERLNVGKFSCVLID